MGRRWASLLVLLLPTLAAADQRAAAGLGVTVGFTAQSQRQAAEMAAAGIGWVRTDLAWSHAEQQPGQYDFRSWDAMVDGFGAQGIRTLLILGYGNALYDGGFPPTSDGARAAFAAFAGAAARHFRGRVSWEIWNEPNVPRFWIGVPDPAGYVALAREAAAAIRREDREAWILGPGLGGGEFDRDYLEATFRLGLLDVVDAVSLHPYAASHPEAAPALYDEVRRLARRYGDKRGIVIAVTEWGYTAQSLGPEAQADYLMRALAVNRAAGIPLTIWYCWQEPVLPWNGFGLIDVRGQPKPAYRALQGSQ